MIFIIFKQIYNKYKKKTIIIVYSYTARENNSNLKYANIFILFKFQVIISDNEFKAHIIYSF